MHSTDFVKIIGTFQEHFFKINIRVQTFRVRINAHIEMY